MPAPRLPKSFRAGFRPLDASGFVALCAFNRCLSDFGWHSGVPALSQDKSRYKRISADEMRIALEHPDSPYLGCVKVDEYSYAEDEPVICLKPIECLVNINPQRYFEDIMTATDDRLGSRKATEDALVARKANEIAKASTPTLERIKRGLSEEKRLTYVQIKSELMEMISAGRIQKLSDVEIERIVLLRMVELEGVMRLIEGGFAANMDREAVSLLNLMRQLGNEAQRMTETSRDSSKTQKSVFSELEELVKGKRLKIEIEDVPENVVIDYNELIEDEDNESND